MNLATIRPKSDQYRIVNMNSWNAFLILTFLFGCLSCKNETPEKIPVDIYEVIASDLDVDHFNIWVTKPEEAKQKLIDIGFSAIPDSLSEVHTGQGTSGRYFQFLNGYLELIFVYDQTELEQNNAKNKDLDFTKRANFQKNGASPFSLALKIEDYDIEKIPFETIPYHQDWMAEGKNIYSAKSSKINIKEPSVFVVYPELESDTFDSLAELKNIPEAYAFAREFYKHPNGAKKVTSIGITSIDLNTETVTMKSVNSIENVSVKNGSEHLMELYFDNNIQGKTFDLRPELPLIIHL